MLGVFVCMYVCVCRNIKATSQGCYVYAWTRPGVMYVCICMGVCVSRHIANGVLCMQRQGLV